MLVTGYSADIFPLITRKGVSWPRHTTALPEHKAGRAMSIAIVDDDEAVREAMESLVLSLGHSVSTFGSAEEFLNSEQISRTSCLVTDLHMPGLSGLDCKTG